MTYFMLYLLTSVGKISALLKVGGIFFWFAVKATHIIVNDKPVPIFKSPTGDSSKASAKGLLFVDSDMKLEDNVTTEKESTGNLQSIFIDGKFVKETSLEEIRGRLKAE